MQECGVKPDEATPAHKIEWLTSLLDRERPPRAKTWYLYGRGLIKMGIDTNRPFQDAEILRAFLLETRRSRNFPRPRPPKLSMPTPTFKKLLANLSDARCPAKSLYYARARAGLKLEWATGLLEYELRNARRGWLEPYEDGWVLNVQSDYVHRRRRIPIVPSDDPAVCPVIEFTGWLRRLPPDPDCFLLPRIRRKGPALDPYRQTRCSLWAKLVLRELAAVGEINYSMLSMRRAFLKRVRDRLGIGTAFYLSGDRSIQTFEDFLRREPDWSRAQKSRVGCH